MSEFISHLDPHRLQKNTKMLDRRHRMGLNEWAPTANCLRTERPPSDRRRRVTAGFSTTFDSKVETFRKVMGRYNSAETAECVISDIAPEIVRILRSCGLTQPGREQPLTERLTNNLRNVSLSQWTVPKPPATRPVAEAQSRTRPLVVQIIEVTDTEIVATSAGSAAQPIRFPISLFSTPPVVGEVIEVSASPISSRPASPRALPGSRPATALDREYEKLDSLLAQCHPDKFDKALQERIDAAWQRLEALHDAAYDELRQELDESVAMPPHELKRLLDTVRAELADDEP